MEAFTIKISSWHYRLIRYTGRKVPKDICAYTRLVLLSILIQIIFWTVAAFASIFVVLFTGVVTYETALWAYLCFTSGWHEPYDFAAIGIITLGIVAFFSALFGFIYWYSNIETSPSCISFEWDEETNDYIKFLDGKPIQPSFVVTAYRAFKEKYCMRIKLDSGNE